MTPDQSTDLADRLRATAAAYPEDMFPPVEPHERIWLHQARPGLMDRIAGSMGRHMSRQLIAAADEIERLCLSATAEAEQKQAIVNRAQFHKGAGFPESDVLWHLHNGEISVGKCMEWLREYIATGKQGPLPANKELPSGEPS